ncbi:hypothetical protein CATMIT_02612 [Catenibacterium mitsuokai DSM 15897]|mgnify:FL=1|uniref:hypothetical protein n=1 Tax=Catenibacterium mitsuokai TaxID=100886 RepID=UPI000196C15A|nr:hypothetical protein [Catenibacterium mitsuokai]EEF92769.1 hypothetical protein CATMIT_02612 [Catenibacterium mitsuokai DSM 15897]UWO53628.1 hypothetical protein NQ499_01950 [Catenibacterium mitsuokai]
MRTWIRPAAAAENYLVNQSVSNGPCIAIACNIDEANNHEKSIGLYGTEGGYNPSTFQGYVCHSKDGCGTASNNALVVQGHKVIGMKEINNQVGSNDLNCTMYTDGTYEHKATNIGFVPGNVIYWTTESTTPLGWGKNMTRVWHHQGLIQSTGNSSNHS